MWRHSSSKAKGKRKQDEGSSSSSQVQSDTSASLFAIIVSFPFIFIYTFSFEFTVMRYCTARSSTRLLHNRWSERPRRKLTWRRLMWSRLPPRSTGPARRLLRSMRGHHLRTVTRRVPNRGETNSRSSRSTTC
jgi:hypothetical protein